MIPHQRVKPRRSGRTPSRTECPAVAILTLVIAAGAGTAAAAQGRISHARSETRSAAQGLDHEMRTVAIRAGVTWAGYRVPMVAGPRHMCCSDSIGEANGCCGGCRLENGSGVTLTNGDAPRGGGIALEPPTEFLVLVRYEGGSVTRLRTFTPECDVDAAGVSLVWLTDVKADESVAWLSALIAAPATRDGELRNRVAKPAVAALALHATRAALTNLLALAKTDRDSRIRGDALFWLAQRAGREAVGAITDAIASDPETEVKKRAVFALSQLPHDEGVPRLIEVARSNRNPEVRRQAFFWLGQTKDPRAVAFFEEILLKK
jgi:hypothetical protein